MLRGKTAKSTLPPPPPPPPLFDSYNTLEFPPAGLFGQLFMDAPPPLRLKLFPRPSLYLLKVQPLNASSPPALVTCFSLVFFPCNPALRRLKRKIFGPIVPQLDPRHFGAPFDFSSSGDTQPRCFRRYRNSYDFRELPRQWREPVNRFYACLSSTCISPRIGTNCAKRVRPSLHHPPPPPVISQWRMFRDDYA